MLKRSMTEFESYRIIAGFIIPRRLRRVMLPDTLHTLPQAERFAYAKLLAHVTRIDDELSIDEMAVFEPVSYTHLRAHET